MKEKHLTLRMPIELYKACIKKALAKGQKEERIVKISEIIRESVEKYVK